MHARFGRDRTGLRAPIFHALLKFSARKLKNIRRLNILSSQQFIKIYFKK